eukprot:m.251980 g.251980  ORF g.251980 m.251980 type:complete len:115 (+) comp99565_c0_seq1:227-571(+)
MKMQANPTLDASCREVCMTDRKSLSELLAAANSCHMCGKRECFLRNVSVCCGCKRRICSECLRKNSPNMSMLDRLGLFRSRRVLSQCYVCLGMSDYGLVHAPHRRINTISPSHG